MEASQQRSEWRNAFFPTSNLPFAAVFLWLGLIIYVVMSIGVMFKNPGSAGSIV